jgi:hypothetical protein
MASDSASTIAVRTPAATWTDTSANPEVVNIEVTAAAAAEITAKWVHRIAAGQIARGTPARDGCSF